MERPIFIYTNSNKSGESSFSGLSDLDIWRKFKDGDKGAFIYIYHTYVDDLFQIGVQLTRDKSLLKDCLQEFFIELHDRIFYLSDTDNIRLYLIKSFRRRVFKQIKKQKPLISQDQIDESFYVEIATDEMNINAQFNKEQLSKLNMALSNLKVKDREIIYYYFYENFGYKKIAEIMDYNHVSSARRAVYKVLRRLKKLMIVVTLVIHSL